MYTNPLSKLAAARKAEAYYANLAERAFNSALRRKKGRAVNIRRAEIFAEQADKYGKMADRIARALRRRKPKPPKPPRKPPRRYEPEYPDDEDYGEEWEFGFEYSSRGGDRSHDVDVNFRIRRKDGRKFSETDAMSVMRLFSKSGGRIPDEYMVSAVNWKHPRQSFKRWRDGQRAFREVVSGPLRNVLDAASEQLEIWRLGNPK